MPLSILCGREKIEVRDKTHEVKKSIMTDPRAYPSRPFVGVGVVIFKENKILLAERDRQPHGKMWSIPGGAQELGETIEEAAIREIKEETGLEIELSGIVDVVDVINRDEVGRVKYHYTLVDFCAKWLSGEAVANDDVSDVKWVRLDEISDEFLKPITKSIIIKATSMMYRDLGSV